MPSECTALVKTLLRPKALERLLKSIRQYYPRMPIIVLDDGPDADTETLPVPEAFAICTQFDAQYIGTEHNIGLSEGRNRLLAACTTRYFVLCDDDFIFTEETDLLRLIDQLQIGWYDLIGMRLRTNDRDSHFEGHLRQHGDTLHLTPIPKQNRTTDHAIPVDVCYNCFVAHTEKIRAVGWDPRLKFIEHLSFFLRLQAAQVKCGYDEGVVMDHAPDTMATPGYQDYRRKRDDMFKLYQEIHGIYHQEGGLSKIR